MLTEQDIITKSSPFLLKKFYLSSDSIDPWMEMTKGKSQVESLLSSLKEIEIIRELNTYLGINLVP
jgi:hypothetical protein